MIDCVCVTCVCVACVCVACVCVSCQLLLHTAESVNEEKKLSHNNAFIEPFN